MRWQCGVGILRGGGGDELGYGVDVCGGVLRGAVEGDAGGQKRAGGVGAGGDGGAVEDDGAAVAGLWGEGEGVVGGLLAGDGGVAEGAPLTVRRKVPLGTPVPVRGMLRFWRPVLGSVEVRVPLRGPRAVGVKVTVSWQLLPGARVVVVQGTVMA